MAGGRLFQTHCPATANALSPSEVVVRGMSSIMLAADREPGGLQLLEIYWNFKFLLEILEISWNLIASPANFYILGR